MMEEEEYNDVDLEDNDGSGKKSNLTRRKKNEPQSPLLPTTTTEADENEQKDSQQKDCINKRKLSDLYWGDFLKNKTRFLGGLGLFPRNWFETSEEHGTSDPPIISKAKILWRTHKNTALLSILFTVISMALLFRYFGPDLYVRDHMDDANNVLVQNVFDPPSPSLFNLFENRQIDEWFRGEIDHQNSTVPDAAFTNGYFESNIYDGRHIERKNVSFTLLERVMRTLCPNDSCMCISSLHLGIPKNVLLLNGGEDSTFLIDPSVEQTSTETFSIEYSETSVSQSRQLSMERPVSILMEYRYKTGMKSRFNFQRHYAACLAQCIEFFTKYT